jgi:hypothetical protein
MAMFAKQAEEDESGTETEQKQPERLADNLNVIF